MSTPHQTDLQGATAFARLQSAIRWRAIFVVLLLVLPAGCGVLFERQARRLEALAEHGEAIEARVIEVSLTNKSTTYAYRVNNQDFTWSVSPADAPFAVGQTFTVTYLPTEPSFSRPIIDRQLAAAEAAKNRSFTWKFLLGLIGALALFTGLAHRDVVRLKAGRPSLPVTPEQYRRRLLMTGLALTPFLLLIGGFHASDAVDRGESLLPVAIGLLIPVALIGGLFLYAARLGPKNAANRSLRIQRWAVPLAIGIALLRLIALLLGH